MEEFNIYGIIGKPVLHSFSPYMMNNAFLHKKINARYLYILVESAKEGVEIVKRLGIKGMNVTAPFKEEIIPHIESLDQKVEDIGSANTIIQLNGQLKAYNTDFFGIKEPIENLQLLKKHAIVLGTGGTAKTALYVLNQLGFKITLIGRNALKLAEYKNQFNCSTGSFENLVHWVSDIDLIVSTLPDASDYIKLELLKKEHILFDANYKNTTLNDLALKTGFQYINGLEWLIHQAKPNFELFTGHSISTDELRKSISERKDLNAEVLSLIGFMGVGKTTVGKFLAKMLSYKFIDVDQLIEQRHGLKIQQIFKQFGEEEFRKMENAALNEVMQMKKIVVSCGGGVIASEENRNLITQNSLCFWLDASVKYCLDGIDLSNRPLLQVDNPLKKAEQIYAERKVLYAQTAHVLVNAENKNSQQIANHIYDEILQSRII